MIGLRVESPNLDAVRALWAQAPEIMGEEMLASVTAADLYLKGELQQRLPKGAGGISGGAGLVGSVFTEEERLQDRVLGAVASGLHYAEWVENGTRPHFPPPESLVEWVRVKLGIQDEDEIERVTYAVANKIARYGTGADFSWAETAEYGEPEVERLMLQGIDRALDRLGAPA
jgi:hypothetical protein